MDGNSLIFISWARTGKGGGGAPGRERGGGGGASRCLWPCCCVGGGGRVFALWLYVSWRGGKVKAGRDWPGNSGGARNCVRQVRLLPVHGWGMCDLDESWVGLIKRPREIHRSRQRQKPRPRTIASLLPQPPSQRVAMDPTRPHSGDEVFSIEYYCTSHIFIFT